MKELVIETVNDFITFLQRANLGSLDDPDIRDLISFVKALPACCCSEDRNRTQQGIDALYKKVIYEKLDLLNLKLFKGAQKEGFEVIRFKGAFRRDKRNFDHYDKLVQASKSKS